MTHEFLNVVFKENGEIVTVANIEATALSRAGGNEKTTHLVKLADEHFSFTFYARSMNEAYDTLVKIVSDLRPNAVLYLEGRDETLREEWSLAEHSEQERYREVKIVYELKKESDGALVFQLNHNNQVVTRFVITVFQKPSTYFEGSYDTLNHHYTLGWIRLKPVYTYIYLGVPVTHNQFKMMLEALWQSGEIVNDTP
jgi:hypothetical protein